MRRGATSERHTPTFPFGGKGAFLLRLKGGSFPPPGTKEPLPGLFGDDEPEKEVHDLPDAEQPEERESDPDQGPIHAEELRQATAHAGKEPV